jgi:cation diffusion facilitator family transporter
MVAHPDSAHVLENRPTRYASVRRVLYGVLFLNLAVAFVKIALGYATGAISILSDGFHSLTDSASNVVALIGISVARRPPDENHPYGHRKYETMASIGIVVFLLLVLVEVVHAAVARLQTSSAPDVAADGIGLMLLTLVVNLTVVWYEKREGHRLASEVLLADAHHTQSDVLTTGAVLLALFGVWLGYPLLDPLAALLVAMFILYACWQIAQGASRILSDEIVIAEGDVRTIVQRVPGVLGCEKIRTRGTSDYVFMDLHVWVDGNTTLSDAHHTSHIVKDALMEAFPHLADVVIHIEPPPLDHRPH